MKTYKIGTRGSLLAVTQSTLIMNECERISGEKFELVLIKTQGDEITTKPLWQLEGKDFFTKELDEALLKGEVDFLIHSYKDLGSIRPEGIKLAAITERRFAQDILLISKETIKKLPTWEGEFKVGTSSPRRIVNLTRSLPEYLPTQPKVVCEMLRGNVNTRIKKLNDGNYDAIVLALAGVERLAHTEKSSAELKELLKDLNYFILPQTVFPSSASQGALGIELREDRDDNGKLLGILSQLNNQKTIEEVKREREVFQSFGGGCHLAVGINVKKVSDDLFLHINMGEVDEKRIEKKYLEGVTYPALPKDKKVFVGMPELKKEGVVGDEFITKKVKDVSLDVASKHVFVTSSHCYEALKKSSGTPEGIWAAGTKSTKDLIAQGYWVNGTADSLGTEDLAMIKTSKALALIQPNLASDWAVLTHEESKTNLGTVTGCYDRVENSVSAQYEEELKNVSACFWTSYAQYQAFMKRFPFLKTLPHFCGMGKTWNHFKENNIAVYPMIDLQEFYHLERK